MNTKFLIISSDGDEKEFRTHIKNIFESWWDLTADKENINVYIVSSKKYTTVKEITEKLNGYRCTGFFIVKIYASDDFFNIGSFGGEDNTSWLKKWATDDIHSILYNNENGPIPNIGLKKKNP